MRSEGQARATENPGAELADSFENLLTIVTPCRNSSNTIRDTIKSVKLAQNELAKLGHSLEHIIIDGESTDGTANIAKKYMSDSKKTRIEVEPPKGIYAAMNSGLRLAKGKYTHILNSDDMIIDPFKYANFVSDCYHADADALLGSIVYLSNDAPPRPIRSWISKGAAKEDKEFKKQIKRGLHYPHPGFIAKTRIYRTNGFDESYSMSADYKLMQEIFLCMTQREKLLLKSEPIIGMRVGGATSNPRAIIKGMEQIRQINKELGITEWTWSRYIKKIGGRLRGTKDKYSLESAKEYLRKYVH